MNNIGILTGGDSAEYNISLLSAETVLKYLKNTKYNGIIIHLKNGKYSVGEQKINTSDFTYIKNNNKITFDKIFIALHGPPAENGLIQSYFDSINLPYTSCNAIVSALTFNKFACNNMLKKLGFKCANSVIIHVNEKYLKDNIIKKVGLPCFVKPNGAGSSYGISKITEKNNLIKAIKQAFSYDNKVIIESAINGIEVSCGVYTDGQKVNALPITEIVSENDFFDYEAKYEGKSQEITPARINKKLTEEIQKTTVEIYQKMKLAGICRVDFIIANNQPYIIEINTIPGLTEESIIPKQLQAANINLTDFFDICLNNLN